MLHVIPHVNYYVSVALAWTHTTGSRQRLNPLITLNIMSPISTARMNAINQLRCSIFQTSYNPRSVRTGAKYLRARLRGPSMVKYYPEVISIPKLIKEFPEMEMVDEVEGMRLQDIEDRKARGKGAPKKTKSKGKLYFFYFKN